LVAKARFIRGFCDFWCFIVVFLWSGCGEMRGKDGLRMCAFRASKIMQIFRIYFFNRLAMIPGFMKANVAMKALGSLRSDDAKRCG